VHAYTGDMSVTIELPGQVQLRLEAEAVRRGITVEDLIGEFAENLPAADEQASETPALSFIGIGRSGRGDLSRRHRDIRAEQTAGLTASDF
jgi:hypothetical protein